MKPSITSWDLEEADQTRERDPRAALEVYAAADPAAVAASEQRLAWLFEQIRHTQPEQFLPLIRYAVEHASGTSRRWALHLLASSHWYHCDGPNARARWRTALLEGHEIRDELWIGCAANLAMSYAADGRTFESLVFNGMALRAAQASGFDYSIGFSSSRRGWQLTAVGELERAGQAFEQAEAAARRLDDVDQHQSVMCNITGGRSRLCRASGDFERALEQQELQVELCEQMPANQKPVLVGAHCSLLDLRYQLFPERRSEILAELEAVPERYSLAEEWRWTWRSRVLPLRMWHAIEEQDDLPAARAIGRELLEFIPEHFDDEEVMERASELGRMFVNGLASPQDSAAAYNMAANAALRRLLSINRSAHELPELAEATPEDWEILDTHRASLAGKHEATFEAIREIWHAGHPACELVLQDDSKLKACGWCKRILSLENQWLPIARFLPPSGDFQVSHGICPSCQEGFMNS